jgi:ferredoxin-type protein NapF
MRIPSRLRPLVQAAFFVGFVLIFLNFQYPVSMPWSSPFTIADPLAAMAGVIFSQGRWLPALLPVGLFIGATMVLGRAFCGWACPVGFLADIAGRARRKANKKNKGRFGYLQYGVLAAVLVLSLFSIEALSVTDPLVVFQRSSYLIWAGAGIPVVLILIVAASLLVERFWCRALCPLGGLLGVVSIISPFGRRLGDSCNNCLKCRRTCPMGAISKENKWDATACTKCLQCEQACPKAAISFGPSAPRAPAVSPSRRSFIAGIAALGMFAASERATSLLTPSSALIRPPGSLAEESFNAACARCGSCAKVCVGEVIVPAGLDAGLERAFTPSLDFDKGVCQRCGTCGQVCPTGAIISLPEEQIKIGTARIDTGLCIAWKDRKKCMICAEVCPKQAVRSAGKLQPVVDEDACVGCGSCQYNCPVEEKAIRVSSAGERRRG